MSEPKKHLHSDTVSSEHTHNPQSVGLIDEVVSIVPPPPDLDESHDPLIIPFVEPPPEFTAENEIENNENSTGVSIFSRPKRNRKWNTNYSPEMYDLKSLNLQETQT